MRLRRRAVLWTILGVSAALKLGWWTLGAASGSEAFVANDTPEYQQMACALLERGTFDFSSGGQPPRTNRTPGYPLFLAAVYAVCGRRYAAVTLAQIALSLGTVALVYALARRLWNTAAGLVAAGLLAVDACSTSSALRVLTDTLFAFLLTCMLAAGIRFLSPERRRRSRWALLGGLLLACATLVRPIGYYLVIPLLIGLVAVMLRRGNGRRPCLRWAALWVLPFLVLVGAWRVRNYRLSGNSSLTPVASMNLLFIRGAAIVAARDGISLEKAQAEMERRYSVPGATWTLGTWREKAWTREALKLILRHPGLYLCVKARGAANLLLASGVLPLVRFMDPGADPAGKLAALGFAGLVRAWAARNPVALALYALSGLHLLTVYAGVLAGYRPRGALRGVRPAAEFMLWGVMLYLVFVSAGPEANARFRVPVMPILAMLAGAGFSGSLPVPAGGRPPSGSA